MKFKSFDEELLYNFWTEFCRAPSIKEFKEFGGETTYQDYPLLLQANYYGNPRASRVIRVRDLRTKKELFIGSCKEVADEINTTSYNVRNALLINRPINHDYSLELIPIDYNVFRKKYKDMYSKWEK